MNQYGLVWLASVVERLFLQKSFQDTHLVFWADQHFYTKSCSQEKKTKHKEMQHISLFNATSTRLFVAPFLGGNISLSTPD